MSKVNKVVVLSHSSGIGGATASLATVASVLSDAGCELCIFTPEGPMIQRWEESGCEIRKWKIPACAWLAGFVYSSSALRYHPVHLILLGLLPLRLWKALKQIRQYFKSNKVDFVLINSLTLFPLGVFLRWTFCGQRPVVVWHLREVLNARLIAISKRFVKWCVTHETDKIIAITSNERAGFEDFPSLTVIHNTIPTKWHGMSTKRKAEATDRPRVMMVSMLLAGKGFQEYLEAAYRLAEKYPNAAFDLYTPRAPHPFRAHFRGYEDTEKFLQESINNVRYFELREGVRWWFDQEMSVELFQSHDVYVRADRAGSPWGRDIIEAMWLGLPIVATGTSEEFISNGETGFLVPPGDSQTLANRIDELISNPELRIKMQKETMKRALEFFDPDIHRRKILQTFGLMSTGKPVSATR